MLACEMACEQSVGSKGPGGQFGPTEGGIFVCSLFDQAILTV